MGINLTKPPKVNLAKKTTSPKSGGGGLNVLHIYSALQLYKAVGPFPLNGPAFDQLAWSIAEGVIDWIDSPINVTLLGLSTGTVGVGAIPDRSTHLVVLPVIPLMTSGLVSAGVAGPLASSLSITVTLAIAHAVTQFGGYIGLCPTVGVGTDISKVVWSNPGTLIASLQESMSDNNMTGVAANRLAHGLGLGIAALMLTGFGWGKVLGPPGPSPSTGPSFSKVG